MLRDITSSLLMVTGPTEELKKFYEAFQGHNAYYWINKYRFERYCMKSVRDPIPESMLPRKGEKYEEYNIRMEELVLKSPKVRCLNAIFPVPENIRRAGFHLDGVIPMHRMVCEPRDGHTWQLTYWGSTTDIREFISCEETDTYAKYEFINTSYLAHRWFNYVSEKFRKLTFVISSIGDESGTVEQSQYFDGYLTKNMVEYDQCKLGYYILCAHIFNQSNDKKFMDRNFPSLIEDVGNNMGLAWTIDFYNKLKSTDIDEVELKNNILTKKMVKDYFEDVKNAFSIAVVAIFESDKRKIGGFEDTINSIKGSSN